MNDLPWYRKQGMLLLAPAFICSAGAQLSTTWPAALVGFASALVFLVMTPIKLNDPLEHTDRRAGTLIFVGIPLAILLLSALVSFFVRDIFPGADIRNPYLSVVQIFARMIIAGIGGTLGTMAGAALARLL